LLSEVGSNANANPGDARTAALMLLPQMEKRGLIERRDYEKDKRVLRLFLTEEGRNLTERAMVIQTDLIERVLSPEPIEQCMAMANFMERIIGVLQQDLSEGD
jgi:DNA-binding MarR family transcriptional regulator